MPIAVRMGGVAQRFVRSIACALAVGGVIATTGSASAAPSGSCQGGARWDATTNTVVAYVRNNVAGRVLVSDPTPAFPGVTPTYGADSSLCSLDVRPARIELLVDTGDDIEISAPDIFFASGAPTTFVVSPPAAGRNDLTVNGAGYTDAPDRWTREFRVRMLADGLDLNGDAAADVLLPLTTRTELDLTLGSGADTVDIRQEQTPIRLLSASVMLGWFGGAAPKQVTLDVPYGAVFVVGADGDDEITVAGTSGRVYGQGGDDRITMALRKSQPEVIAGDGDDVVVASTTSWRRSDGITDAIELGSGDDVLAITGGRDYAVTAGDGNDVVRFTKVKGYNTISGGRGNDVVHGALGIDVVIGHKEADGGGDDRYFLGANQDSVEDHWGSNVIDLGRSRGRVDAGRHQKRGQLDVIRTGDGNDLVVLYGRAKVRMGAGGDTLALWGRARGAVAVDCGPGRDKADRFARSPRRSCELQNLNDGGRRDAPLDYVHPPWRATR